MGEVAESFDYGLNAAAKNFDGRHKYIRITDIDDSLRFFDENNVTSPDIDFTDADNYLLKLGDILFARTGASVGKSYIHKDDESIVYFAGFLIRARFSNEYDADYIYQNTLTEKYNTFIKIMSQRSGQPGVNAQEYASYSLGISSLEEMQKLGTFFRNLDEIIAATQRKVAGLKQLKAAYLQQMFPQAGELVPRVRFGGFTGDWTATRLVDIADIVGGGTPDTSVTEYWGGEIDWYSPVEIGEQIYVDNSQKKITMLGLQKSSAKVLPIGTVLFTSRAGIGNTAILKKEGATNQGFQSIVPHCDVLDTYFIFSRTNELKRFGETNGAGSTFVEVSGKQMSNMPISIPSLQEQVAIGNFFCNFDTQIETQSEKIRKLKGLKTAYLQKMFI